MEIRPWRTGDATLAAAALPYLSMASLTNRFLVGTGGRLPAAYERLLASGPQPTWDAQVAATDGHLVGWAEFGRRDAASPEADIAVIVADPWHRRGIATQLIRALLPRCSAAGVTRIHADVLPSNRAANGLLHSLFGDRLRAAHADGVMRYDVPLEPPIIAVPLGPADGPLAVLAGV